MSVILGALSPHTQEICPLSYFVKAKEGQTSTALQNAQFVWRRGERSPTFSNLSPIYVKL